MSVNPLIWMEIGFLFVAFLTILLFHISNSRPTLVSVLIIVWSVLHSVLAFMGFYKVMDTIPPRFVLLLLPLLIVFIYAMMPKQLQWMKANRNQVASTFLHTVRIPVEIILYYLFVHKMVPELMTFEGRNYDILAGLSAPIVGILLFKKKLPKLVLIVWNIIGLALVLFILVNGLLSAELPIQQFGFEQPNVAVTLFPFVLLPATVVPLVVYTHITDIIKLTTESRT